MCTMSLSINHRQRSECYDPIGVGFLGALICLTGNEINLPVIVSSTLLPVFVSLHQLSNKRTNVQHRREIWPVIAGQCH